MLDRNPEVIALSKIEGRREMQPKKAGRRKLVKKDERPESDGVKEKRFGTQRYCEQNLDSLIPSDEGTSSKRWNEYLLDRVKVTGVLTADRTLIWFPTQAYEDTNISEDEAIKTAAKIKPNLPVLAVFEFGEGSELTTHRSSVSVRSLKDEYNDFTRDVADYFVRSLGESEEHAILLYNFGQLVPAFTGSTHEYFRFH